MPANDTPVDLTMLSDTELDQLRRDVMKEQQLRRRLDASPEKIEHAIAEYQKAHGIGEGEPWEPPGNALQAYRRAAEVKHRGKDWASTRGGNLAEPGENESWEEKPEDGDPDEEELDDSGPDDAD